MRATDTDAAIPTEKIASIISKNHSATVWLLVDPKVGECVDWVSIREITSYLRRRSIRKDC